MDALVCNVGGSLPQLTAKTKTTAGKTARDEPNLRNQQTEVFETRIDSAETPLRRLHPAFGELDNVRVPLISQESIPPTLAPGAPVSHSVGYG